MEAQQSNSLKITNRADWVTVGETILSKVEEIAKTKEQWRVSETVELGFGTYLKCDNGTIRLYQTSIHYAEQTLAVLHWSKGWLWRDLPVKVRAFDEAVYNRMDAAGDCLCLACTRARKFRNRVR